MRKFFEQAYSIPQHPILIMKAPILRGAICVCSMLQEVYGLPEKPWGNSLDPRGLFIWTQGTSFASPAVAGAIALMKSEDPNRQLTRAQLVDILQSTARYDSLDASKETVVPPPGLSAQQYFFGRGLVDAEAAVKAVQAKLR